MADSGLVRNRFCKLLFACLGGQHAGIEPGQAQMRIGCQIANAVDQLRPAVIVVDEDVTLCALDQRKYVQFVRHDTTSSFALTSTHVSLHSYRRTGSVTSGRRRKVRPRSCAFFVAFGVSCAHFSAADAKLEKMSQVSHADFLACQERFSVHGADRPAPITGTIGTMYGEPFL